MKKPVWIHITGSIIIVISLLAQFDSSLEIINNSNPNYLFNSFDDSDEGGNTISNISKNQNSICLDYTLGTFKKQYAGISINKTEGFNLKKYHQIRLQIESKHKGRSFINFKIENSQKELITFRHPINLIPGNHIYNVNVKDFKMPDWIIRSKKLEEKNPEELDLNAVEKINIIHNTFINGGQKDQLCVSNILLFPDNRNLIIVHLILLAIYNSTLLFLGFRKKPKELIVEYKATDQLQKTNEQIQENEISSLLEFINENYSNPELNLRLIKKSLGIHENKITLLIKKETTLSYKDYVNSIRIEEAKRLLKNPDSTISEICYTTGFNSVVTFNRVFKKATSITPSEFRDKEYNT